MLPKCEHGVAANDGRFVGAYNAPISPCMCCGVYFPYIDSASYGPDGGYGTHWTPKDRCASCGGRYEKWDMRVLDVAHHLANGDSK